MTDHHQQTETERHVLQAIESMTQAFHAGDLKSVLATYGTDAVVAFQPGQTISGPAALAEAFSEAFQLHPRFTYAGHEVLVAGDLALHIAPWRMRGAGPDGQPIEDQGLSVAVLRRQPDGAWKLLIDQPHGSHLMEAAR